MSGHFGQASPDEVRKLVSARVAHVVGVMQANRTVHELYVAAESERDILLQWLDEDWNRATPTAAPASKGKSA